MDDIPFSKVMDVLVYLGLVLSDEDLSHIASVHIGPESVDVERYAVDEQGKHRIAINGDIMIGTVKYPISRGLAEGDAVESDDDDQDQAGE